MNNYMKNQYILQKKANLGNKQQFKGQMMPGGTKNQIERTTNSNMQTVQTKMGQIDLRGSSKESPTEKGN